MQSKADDIDLNGFSNPEQELPKQILKKVISSIAGSASTALLQDIIKFISSFESISPVQTITSQDLAQFKTKITDSAGGCIIKSVVQDVCSYVALIIDFKEQLVYFFDINCQKIEYYNDLKSELETNYTSFKIRFVRQDGGKAIDDENYSTISAYYDPVLTILIWAMNKFYDNEYIWYLLVEQIANHPDLSKDDRDIYDCCLRSLDKDDLFHVDFEKEYTIVRNIVRDAAETCMGIKELKEKVSLRRRAPLDKREESFIEEKYIKDCTLEFFNQVAEDIARKINDEAWSVSSFIEQIKQMKEIPQPFQEIVSFEVVKNCTELMTKRKRKEFILDFKDHCLKTLLNECDTLNSEIEFLNENEKMLRELFIARASEKEDQSKRANDTWGKYQELYRSCDHNDWNKCAQFISSLQATDIVEFQRLKLKALPLNVKKSFRYIPSNLKKLLETFEEPLKTTEEREGCNTKLIIEGNFIKLDDVEKAIAEKKLDDVYQLEIIANQLICINADLKFPGMNIVLVSPSIHVDEKHFIDVSGLHGKNLYIEPASNGKNPGENGFAGEPGDTGHDGGNVYICAEEISNSQGLTILSNGGNGGNGQNGGGGADGINGRDGKEVSIEKLNEMFPDKATFEKFFVQQLFTPLEFVVDVLECGYSELTTNDGCKVIYCNYSDAWYTKAIAWFGYPKLQSYCIHYGGKGEPGGEGGMGGCGGKAGDGGRAGDVDIHCRDHEICVKRCNGKSGEKGDAGTGGKGGFNGRKGFDTARVTPSQYRSSRYYGPARLRLSYIESKDDIDTAYCPYNKKYAKITAIESPCDNMTNDSYGEQKLKSKISQKLHRIDADKHKRSILITKSYVHEMYGHILQASHNSELQKIDLSGIRNAITEMTSTSTELHLTNVKYKLQKSYVSLINEIQTHILPHRLVDIRKKADRNIKDQRVSFGCRMKDEFYIVGIHLESKFECADDVSITIEEVKILKNHLRKNAIEDSKEIKDLVQCTQQLKSKLAKRRPPKFLKIVKEQRLVDDACQQIEEIFEILLMKYKFATLAQFLEETKKEFEYQQEKMKDENRKFLVSSLKKRLIHLNFDSIKGILNTSTVEDIDGYFSGRMKEIKGNLSSLTEAVKLNSEIDQIEKQAVHELGPEGSEYENKRSVKITAKSEQLTSNNDATSKLNDLTRNTRKQKSLMKKRKIPVFDQIRKNAGRTPREHKEHDLFTESLEKLKEIGSESAKLLSDVMTLKHFVDGIHLSHQWLDLFISEVAALGDSQTLKIVSWIVSTTHMSKWIAEYTVTQSLCTGSLDVEKEEQMRDSLYSIQDVKWIVALWKYTFKTEFFQLPSCYKVLELLKDVDWESDLMMQLDCTNLADWELILHDHFSYKRLLTLPIDWTDESVIEAQIYLDELKTVHGDDIYSKINDALQCAKSIELDNVMMLLRNLHYGNWQPTEKLLSIVPYMPSVEWENSLTPFFSSMGRDRPLEELVNLMKEDWNNSFNAGNDDGSTARDKVIAELDEVHRLLKRKIEDGKVTETFGKEFIENWKRNFDSKVVTMAPEDKKLCTDQVFKWSKKIRDRAKEIDLNGAKKEQFIFENISEIFSHVEIGISLVTGFKLRQAQRLAIMLLLMSKSCGLLAQVATGEGKTIIITAFCIMKNLVGNDVDVITSSPVLAERDATHQKNVYELFGTTVSHNCSNDDEQRTEAYKSNIVYGEISSFQRDFLLQQFYDKNILGKRGHQNIVIDEVDSMLLDKAENVLYLPHDIVDLKDLEPLFVYLWNFIHGKEMAGTESDISQVHAAVMNAMLGSVPKKDFFSALHCYEDGDDRLETIWKFLIHKEIIDSKHRIKPVKELKDNELELILPQELKCEVDQDIEGVILDYLKNNLRKGIFFRVPNYLEEFIDLHLVDWIKNAFTARFMEEGRNYIIDINRSDVETGQSANVVIMDTDTGVEQFNMQWSEALHIFIQLKHSCRISLETLKAVFISNIEFFKHYQPSIFGLTGTLGIKKERDILQDVYDVNYVTVPTFRPKQFHHYEDLIFDDEQEWLEKTVENAITIADTRPVLMVCEDIKRVDMFERNIKLRTLKDLKVYVYKHSYEKLDIVKDNKEIEDGCIIIATNLAGRGTDLKISKKISEFGGLHVILTYMPRNIRISEQAFGRAARKGDEGSGQFSIHQNDARGNSLSPRLRLLRLRSQKHTNEQAKLSNFKEHYNKYVKVQENYFREFQEIYNGIQADLTKKGENLSSDAKLESADWKNEFESKKSVVLKACLDRWAFWLDTLGRRIANGNENSESLWNSFKAKLESDCNPSRVFGKIKSPTQLMNLGKAFIKGEDYSQALKVFGKLCDNEPYFSESAHYYSAHCILKMSKLKNEDSRRQFCYHLYKSNEILERKLNVYSELNAIVNSVRAFYGKPRYSFLVHDSYKKQKTDEINILETFRKSIIDMLGHNISMQKLVTVSEDVLVAKRAFGSRKIVQGARFTDDMSSTKYDELHDRYEFYASEIKQKINELREKKAEPKPENFKGILPNREEFWDLMREKNLISREKEFVVIDKEKFESLAPKLHEKIVKQVSQLKSSKEFEEIFRKKSENQTCETKDTHDEEEAVVPICMFPEKVEDIIENKMIAVDKKDVSEWDEIFRETLDSFGLTLTCKSAFFIKQDSMSTGLAKYDGIKKKDFLEIRGVKEATADELFRIVEPCLKEHDLPSMDEIDMHFHKKYNTEVKNLMEKHYKYRAVLKKLGETDTTAFEDLLSEPHKHIWEDLINLNIILPAKVMSDVTEESAQMLIDDEKKLLIKTCNAIGYFFDFKKKSNLASFLYESKASVYRCNTIDSKLKDIREVLDKEVVQSSTEELAVLSARGFDEIITVEEQKWSWPTILNSFQIAFIGLSQLALGALVYNLEPYTKVFLIHEGICDILFACKAAISGHCSMKEYAKQKMKSCSVAILVCGIDAYFQRETRFSNFVKKLLGRKVEIKVDKNMTKTEIVQQATMICIEKLFEAQGTEGILERVKEYIHRKLTAICRNIIAVFRNEEANDQFKEIVKHFYEIFGPEKARIEVMKIGKTSMESAAITISDAVGKIVTVLNDEVAKACKNIGIHEIATASWTSNIGEVVTSTILEGLEREPCVKILFQATATCHEVIARLSRDLQDKLDKLENELDIVNHSEKHKIEKSVIDNIVSDLQEQCAQIVEKIVTTDLIGPFLKSSECRIMKIIGKGIERRQSSIETKIQLLQRKGLHMKNADAEMSMEGETRDENHYAQILRERNAPMGINEAQAISNVTSRRIHIIACKSVERRAFPESFNPTSGQVYGEPVVLYFHTGQSEENGHFSDSPRMRTSSSDQRESTSYNNCLLDAVSRMIGELIDRNKVVDEVEHNVDSREQVANGTHWHYIDIGRTGDGTEPEEGKDEIKKKLEELQVRYKDELQRHRDEESHEKEEEASSREPLKGDELSTGLGWTEKIKNWWSNTPQSSDMFTSSKSARNVGNNAGFSTEQIPQLIYRDIVDEKIGRQHNFEGVEPFTWCDLYRHVRFCLCHLVFDRSGICGHLTSVDSSTEMKGKDEKVITPTTILHNALADKILRTTSPPDALKVCLQEYLKAIEIFETKLKDNPNYFKGHFTAIEHDLTIPEHRDEFFTDLQRTRFKIAAVLEKIGGEENTIKLNNTDAEFESKLKTRLQSAKELEELGDILKSRILRDGSIQPQEPTELEEDKDKMKKLEELIIQYRDELQQHYEEESHKKTEETSPCETFEYEEPPIVFKLIESDKSILKSTPQISGKFQIDKSALNVGITEGFDIGGAGDGTEPKEEKDEMEKLVESQIHYKDEHQEHYVEEGHKKKEEKLACETFKYGSSPIIFKLKESDTNVLRTTFQSSGKFARGKSARNIRNIEGFSVTQVPQLIYRDIVDEERGRQHNFEGIEPYTWCDLYRHVRFRFCHLVFGRSGIYGHLTSVDSSQEMQGRDQKAITSTIMLHNDLAIKILHTASPPDALKLCLQEHLKAIGSREIFETKLKDNPNYLQGHFTATGHDLTIPEHRDEFFTGLQRTRYKIAAVLEKISGEENTIKLNNTDAEFESKLKTRLQSAKELEELGDILKSREDCL